MRIKERLKTHVVEDVKERIRDSRLTPVRRHGRNYRHRHATVYQAAEDQHQHPRK